VGEDECALIAIALNVCNLAATIVAVALMDQVGRRRLLLASLLLMAAAATLLTLVLSLASDDWLPLGCGVSMVLYVGAYAIGLGPVSGLLPAELFPAAYRAAGTSVAMCVQWLSSFAVAQLFLAQAAELTANLFVPHVVILVVGFLCCVCSVPETRGKSLDQIEKELMTGT